MRTLSVQGIALCECAQHRDEIVLSGTTTEVFPSFNLARAQQSLYLVNGYGAFPESVVEVHVT